LSFKGHFDPVVRRFAHRNIKFTHSRQSRPFGQKTSTKKIDQLLENSGQVCRILIVRKYIIVLMDGLFKIMVDKRDVFIVSVAQTGSCEKAGFKTKISSELKIKKV
jgi:hypothetical protein